MLLAWALRRLIRRGHLTLVDARGRTFEFGTAGALPAATMRLHDATLHHRLALEPELALGEAWMDGTLTTEGCTLGDLLTVLSLNLDTAPPLPWEAVGERLAPILRRLQQYNPIARARQNVAHHYDLSDRLYDLFLDSERQYSCAYFRHADESLETAQRNKMRHIAAKLAIEPGMRVLDIGSGWGGLGLYLAQTCGADVTGLTLSTEQHARSNARARAMGLHDRVRFALRDYREEAGTYDRIVSIGMFEHVGVNHYPAFFTTLKRLLVPQGAALLHAIGRMDGPGTTNAWLRKYIFPGGYAPALSEVLPVIERAGLWACDVEILRLHYAETLRHWHERFQSHRSEIAALYDERFCRMWEFYLKGAEMDFRYLRTMVFQIQITRRIDALPPTRDYMVDWEQMHA
ncbi:cyclopropane-fatty-acyl-phospholipid synthase family protein [Vineibacter terrae]|uniref:cyclopropane-fatty-acyl-phospholipid synthase family protein n=1 Tax=Vineibacter terrae TaxID=2586908 RepID=UPI002E32FBC9|nr:cyclopropane-fatty-acyl-phospholipid synthase family protein [Vineibacter terrae]HEX2891278.1 cyclopropane-fatty-acyl-phospholipid synthase family protein [Vineibacter terrae]